MSAGERISLFLSDNAQLYFSGDFISKNIILPHNLNISFEILDFVASTDSVYIMSKNGSVYSFGRNTFGQLGLNDTISRSSPTLIELFPSNVTKIIKGNGLNFILMLTNTSEVVSFGRNIVSS